MKKDDMLEITIEDISSDGSGVGKADGFALFVKDTIPGDQVKVKIMKMKKRYGYARLMEILVPSPDRIQAPCPVARQCGGCQIQQMSYERQLTFKENKVCNNLRRLGGLDLSAMEVEPICGMEEPFHYRNKAQFPIGRDKNGKIIAGFYAGRTHSIIANTDCLLGAEENEAILNEVISWMEVCKVEPYDEKTGKGLVRHVLIRKGFTTKELMVCLVINGRKIPQVEKLVDRLQKIEGMTAIMANVNAEQTNVILGKEIQPIWGQDYIEDYIGNVKYRISPLSFYQVNPVQTEKLYGKALEYAGLTGKETVSDIYCGIGPVSPCSCTESKTGLRRRDCAACHRRCERQCQKKRHPKCRVLCWQSRRNPASQIRNRKRQSRCDRSRSAKKRLRSKPCLRPSSKCSRKESSTSAAIPRHCQEI